ncbi:MAG: hypothetical protein ABI685_11650 [Ferruginibacter sp.]
MKKATGPFLPICMFFCFFICETPVFAGTTKLYLATNKETYFLTESVQFQIFLLNTSNNNKTVYVELLDCKGNKLEKKMLPLTSGISWGNMELPSTDEASFYILYCYVINKDTVESDCSKKVFINRANRAAANNTGKDVLLNFFSEGGTFVAELENNLLISCADENGNPIATKGKITDERNRVLSRFTTDESGFAKISFNPEFKAKYLIVAETKNGKEIKKDLPVPDEHGVNLRVMVNKDSLSYRVFSFMADENQLDYKLDILSDGKTVYTADINFQLGLSVIQETLSLKDLAAGFLTFRLTGKNNKIYARRIMYNGFETAANSLLRIVDTVTKKVAATIIPAYVNGYAYLNILAKDKADSTGNDLNNKSLKDISEQPVIINTTSNKISFNDLLISCDKQALPHSVEQVDNNPFLTLSGTVYDSENKPIRNKKINLIFLHKDQRKDYLVSTTDRSGNFNVAALIFYDTVTVYYQLADNSDEKNNIWSELKVTPAVSFSGNETNAVTFNCAVKNIITNIIGNINTTIADTTKKTEKTLKEVTVKGKIEKEKTNTEKFIEENVSAQNNRSTFLRNEFDFIAKPEVIDSRPLFEYLRGRINLSITISQMGTLLISTMSGDGIGVYLDDMEISGSLSQVSHLQIKDVALVRYYSMPLKPRLSSTRTKYSAFFGSSGGGGDLMIYTRKGFTPTEQVVKGLPKISIVGYDRETPARVLNLPSINPLSLYWKPNWSQQKEETIYIALPANTNEKNVQVIIEGINSEKVPFTFTKNLVFN